jgi:hypothetical protein
LTKLPKKSDTSINIYEIDGDKPASKEFIIDKVNKLCFAFKGINTDEFRVVLIERIMSKEMTENQLLDTINNVIDNCVYPTPTIASIFEHALDKSIKLYTYKEVLATDDFNSFSRVDYNDCKDFFLSNKDIVRYELQQLIIPSRPAFSVKA